MTEANAFINWLVLAGLPPQKQHWGTAEFWIAGDPRAPDLVNDWLGPRDWWWSRPQPAGHRVAIVSSRLPRILDAHGSWLTSLRAGLTRVRDVGAVAVVGHGSAGHELILRGTTRAGIPTLLLHCCDMKLRSAKGWAKEWAGSLDRAEPETQVDGWCLPKSHEQPTSIVSTEELQTIPERDRAAVAWADEVMVLGLRTGGNLHRLLRHRLSDPRARVLLADQPGLQSPRARTELLNRGAKLWTPQPPTPPAATAALPARREAEALTTHSSSNPQSLIPLPAAERWDFLTHTTRACSGPWPGQSRTDHLDSLLDARPDADHSRLAALLRIVKERRLRASNQAIRGGHRVVSFTAVPLAELPQLHVFRSHRGRWDFEPYGICIRRTWLERHGARPVFYVGLADWKRVPDDERPFFQHLRRLDASSIPPCGQPSSIDWSGEREWRAAGDVDLSELAAPDAILFARTVEEARKLLEISPWPVTVLG